MAGDVPHPPQPGEPSRDLPAEIVRQLCEHLDELEAISSTRMRAAVELLIDTGRRPYEICGMRFDCLARDSDGAPVLVYDNHKAARLGRRLPISEATAAVITTQQAQAHARFPHTPAAELKLLPSLFANPDGRKGIRAESLSERHRVWIRALPALLVVTADGVNRDDVTAFLERRGIETRPLMPLVSQPVYADLFTCADLPVARWLNERAFCIGCHPGLRSGDLQHVIDSLTSCLATRSGASRRPATCRLAGPGPAGTGRDRPGPAGIGGARP